MSLQLIVLAVALAFGGGFASAWQVQDWRAGSAANERQKAALEDFKRGERKVDGAAYQQEKVRVVIRDQFHTITKEVDRAIQTDFYAADAPACLDDAGVRAVNAGLRPPAAAASQPASAVPGPRRPWEWFTGRRPALGDHHDAGLPRMPGQGAEPH